ncbi:MAG: acyltransferase family protein [Synechococcus sp.]|nr:acyltransferase family protein [Synechococcus sp.]
MAAVANPPQTPNKIKQAKSSYRPEIDGLRAFAIIAVIINHFNKDWLPSGYLGVDIFFVISGYVITSSLSGRESKNLGDFLSGFYQRRIKRLVPALVVFVLVTSILICLFNPDPGTALKTGMTSLFGLSNLYLFKQSTDYFAQSTELNPFTHTWSLGVEEQFYLLFPLFIWFSGFGRQAKNGARNLFVWIGALTVASLTSFICLYQANQPAAYFLMPPRFWEMAAGCLIFIGFQKRAKIERTLEKAPPLLVVTAIVAVMFLPISWAVPATISTVVLSAILIACLKSGTAAFTIFTHKKVVYIGLISYSLYLWHWGILSISRWSTGIHWWSSPLLLLLMFILASFSYACIERPLRGIPPDVLKPKAVFLLGLCALGGSATVVTAASKVTINELTVVSALFFAANPDMRRVTFDYGNGVIASALLSAPPWDSKTNPVEAIALARCHYSRPITDQDFKACLNPPSADKSKSSNPRFFIFGDSHAANYAFAIRKAFPGMVRMVTVGHGCGYVSPADAKTMNNTNMNCPAYISKADAFVNAIPSGSVVVVGNDWRKDSIKRKSANQEVAIRRLAEIANKRGAMFILLDDVPPIGDPNLSSPKWYRPFAREGIYLSEVNRQLAGLDAIGRRLEKDFENVKYLKLRNGLCESNKCSSSIGGKVLYWNDGHLTVNASERLATEVKNQLQSFVKP